MYRKVLVPLDGSPLAECVLDHVKPLAQSGQIDEILLLSVVEIPPGWAMEGVDIFAIRDRNREEAQAYLSRIRDALGREGISRVTATVLVGNPADVIAETTAKEKVDLIAIATHGRTGIGKWVFGSVAGRVLQHARVPVLMIRPQG